MNQERFRELEKKLLEKRRVIANPLATLGAAMDFNPEHGRDEADRVNASQVKEMTWLGTAQERLLLELVEAALSRIQDGTFGECLHCSQEIGEKRLTAIPWAQYCVTCQELLEQYGR